MPHLWEKEIYHHSQTTIGMVPFPPEASLLTHVVGDATGFGEFIFTPDYEVFKDAGTDSMKLSDGLYDYQVEQLSGTLGGLTTEVDADTEGLVICACQYIPDTAFQQLRIDLDGVTVYDSTYMSATGEDYVLPLGALRKDSSDFYISQDVLGICLRFYGNLTIQRRASGSSSEAVIVWIDFNDPSGSL